jgi:hypothetical protein
MVISTTTWGRLITTGGYIVRIETKSGYPTDNHYKLNIAENLSEIQVSMCIRNDPDPPLIFMVE